MVTRLGTGFLAILLLSFTILAQKDEDAEKQRQQHKTALVTQILSDIPNLKLAENKALVYARAGIISWNWDQKSARVMFQNAVSELMNAQMLAESSRKSNGMQNELLTGGSTRPQILSTIASRDAELALELLVKTRPAEVARAMAASTVKNNKISGYAPNNNYMAQNEFNMEQSFARMAAEQNPERAEKLLKDSLAKGLSNETLNLLKKLAERDRTAATGIASDIVGKLLEAKFIVNGQPDYQHTQTMISVLTDYVGQSSGGQAQIFTESQMHQLADKLISYYLEYGAQQGSYLSYSVVQVAEKFSPSMVDRLKSIARNSSGRGLYSEGWDPEVQKLMSGDASPDQLATASRKYSGNVRQQLLQQAANKYAQQGDIGKAKDLISDNFSDTALDEAMRNLDWQYTSNLMGQGRFEEAETLIGDLPESSRIGALINLANNVFQRDPEKNKSYALSLIREARELVGDTPENSMEMGNLMQIAGAYVNIEPGESFNIFEALVPQINELADATAVLNGFQGNGNVRNGEFLLNQGNLGYFGADFSNLRSLADKDFDRAAKLIDSFNRRELRISLKLQLAEQL